MFGVEIGTAVGVVVGFAVSEGEAVGVAVPVVPEEVVVSAAGVCVTALSGETVGVEVLELLHLFK